MARRAWLGSPCVAVLEHIGLLDDLPRVAEQLRPVVGERDAAVASREDGDAQFAFELFDSRGQVGLGGVEVVRRGVYRAVLRDGDEVAQLLQCHGGPFLDAGFDFAAFSRGCDCCSALNDAVRRLIRSK